MIGRFQQLLGGLSDRDFFREYYGKQWFLNKGSNEASKLRDLLNLEDLERILFETDDKDTRLLVVGLDNIARHSPEQDPIAEWLNGRSLVFHQVDKRLPAVWRFARELESELKCTVSCNLYLTPPHGHAFTTHYDTHDVFILQIRGTKVWRIGGVERECPLPFQDRSMSPKQSERHHQLMLEPGDVLYIPRGVLHDAKTEGTLSCHVTVGIEPKTYLDLILTAVTLAADRDARFRAYLPLGSFKVDDEQITTAVELMRDIDDQAFRDAGNAFWELFASERRRTPFGVLRLSEEIERLSASDVFRAVPNLMCTVSRHSDKLQVMALGRSIDLPVVLEQDLELCLSGKVFQLRDLPGQSSLEDRIKFVRHLIVEGLVQRLEANDDRSSVAVDLVKHGAL